LQEDGATAIGEKQACGSAASHILRNFVSNTLQADPAHQLSSAVKPKIRASRRL
jgi:hypothetical protein